MYHSVCHKQPIGLVMKVTLLIYRCSDAQVETNVNLPCFCNSFDKINVKLKKVMIIFSNSNINFRRYWVKNMVFLSKIHLLPHTIQQNTFTKIMVKIHPP